MVKVQHRNSRLDKLPNLVVSKKEAEERINKQIKKGEEIKNIQIDSEISLDKATVEYNKWDDFNVELLRRIFNTEDLSVEYSEHLFYGISVRATFIELVQQFQKNVQNKIDRLESIRERLNLFDENIPLPISFNEKRDTIVLENKVFLVHGHDSGLLHETARFLEKLEIIPIILSEEPGKGQTIIEKIESNSDVSFAIVLFTPDDVGRGVSETTELRKRARQNVILELGYFLGKLGRSRVAVIYDENVEMPSDYHGVNYIRLDSESIWKMTLAKEMKVAKLNIDLNKLV